MIQRRTYDKYLGCNQNASYSCKKAVDNYLKAIENIADNEELKSCARQTMTRHAPYGSFEEWTKDNLLTCLLMPQVKRDLLQTFFPGGYELLCTSWCFITRYGCPHM